MTSNESPVSRRRYIQLISGAAATTALAGCGSSGDDASTDGGSGSDGGGSGGDDTETSGDGAGSGSEASDAGGYETLELQHWWTAGGDAEAMGALLEAFREKHPDVEIQENPVSGAGGGNLHAVVQNRVLNNDPPSTWQDWPGANLQPYVEADKLNDIGDEVWTDELRDAYLDGPKLQARAGDPDNPFVAVPLNIHRINNLFYNVEVVEEAGVDPASLSSPQELIDAMETIESETDAVGMGQETSSAQGTVQLWAVTFLAEAGADTYMDFINGNTDGHEAAVRGALETVEEYANHYTSDAGSINQDEAGYKVANGEAAFMNQGDWQAGNFQTIEDFDYESGWDHVPWPGTGDYYQLNMDGFAFPKNNPSPDATLEFLKFLGTVEAQETFNPIKGSIPPRSDVPSDEFPPFQRKQMEQFANSQAQPPSIAHGLAVPPNVLSSITEVMASFVSGYDVDAAQQGLLDAVNN